MRFEYALKEKQINNNANFQILSQNLGNEFFRVVEKERLAPTLLSNPPSRQVKKNGQLGWEKVESPKTSEALLKCVERVRGNLLHGGKSGHPDEDRNADLIADSRRVLTQALEMDDVLREHFEGKY